MLDPAFRSLADCDLTEPLQGPCSAVRTSDQVSSWLRLSSISRRFSVELHFKCLFAALESAYLISWKWIEIYFANKQKLPKILHKSQRSVSFIEYNLESSAYELQLASNGFSGIVLLFSLCGLRCRIYISAHPKTERELLSSDKHLL